MKNFTVTNNYYLDNLYKRNKVFTKELNRENVKNGILMAADSKALINGTAAMNSIDYGDEKEDESLETSRFYRNLKAFADAYNYTVDSTSKSEATVPKKMLKKIKKLYSKYQEKLETYGIKFNKDGYMKLDKRAIDKMDKSKYESLFGEDSEFTSELKGIAEKLLKHIDYSV